MGAVWCFKGSLASMRLLPGLVLQSALLDCPMLKDLGVKGPSDGSASYASGFLGKPWFRDLGFRGFRV